MLALILVAYTLIGLQTARKIGWRVYEEERFRHYEFDGGAFGIGIVGGLFTGLVWPLTFAFLGVRALFDARGEDIAALIFSPPKSVKREQKIKQLEREAKQRDRRIAELERETGV